MVNLLPMNSESLILSSGIS